MGGRLDQHSEVTDIAAVPSPDAGDVREPQTLDDRRTPAGCVAGLRWF